MTLEEIPDELQARPYPAWAPEARRGPTSMLNQKVASPSEAAQVLLAWFTEQATRPLAVQEWHDNDIVIRRRWILEDTGERLTSEWKGFRWLATLRRLPTRTLRLRG